MDYLTTSQDQYAKRSFKTIEQTRVMRVEKDIELHPIYKNDKDIGLEAQSLF